MRREICRLTFADTRYGWWFPLIPVWWLSAEEPAMLWAKRDRTSPARPRLFAAAWNILSDLELWRPALALPPWGFGRTSSEACSPGDGAKKIYEPAAISVRLAFLNSKGPITCCCGEGKSPSIQPGWRRSRSPFRSLPCARAPSPLRLGHSPPWKGRGQAKARSWYRTEPTNGFGAGRRIVSPAKVKTLI